MEEQWKEYFRLYSKSREFDARVNEARDIISQNLEHSYVAYSGGKDSIALLHLASTTNETIPVFHFIAGKYLIPEVLEKQVLDNAMNIAPSCRLKTFRFKMGDFASSRSNLKTGAWYRAFYSSLALFKSETRTHRGLVGLRSEESSRRKSRLQKESSSEIYPLKNWTWKDVWAYITFHKLPYPVSYDSYAELLGWDQARFVSFFDGEFDKLNSTAIDNLLMWREKY